ncbi:MAG: hypothetical protein Q8N88_03735 [Nanoarchaeota archaeon]|nr:hypothetical protein [Nanoarchaeota archaeon]
MQKEIKRVLFYAYQPRFFRSSLLGNLYEIAQVYPVILLSEELDSKTQEILQDKKLFPKIEKIIPVNQYSDSAEKMNLFKKNKYFCNLAKEIIDNYKPDIVIATGGNFFESYLRRFARQINALNLVFARNLIGTSQQRMKEYVVNVAYAKLPHFFPYWAKILFFKIKLYLGQLFCFWLLPLLIGQKPFLNELSYVLRADTSRFRGVDYFIVFSKQNYYILKGDGVPAERIYILAHPLLREQVKGFLKETYYSNIQFAKENNEKVITVMWRSGESFSFRRDNDSLIPKEEILKSSVEVVKLLATILKEWRIFIKPHPRIQEIAKLEKTELEELLKPVSELIEVTDPRDPLEKYLTISDVMAGLSPSSAAIYDAYLNKPEKPILVLDLHQEFSGDAYKDFDGIEYIDNKEKLISILEAISDGKYHKKEKNKKDNEEVNSKEFPNAIEMLEFLYEKRRN